MSKIHVVTMYMSKYKDPLFRASDVGEVLEISTIRSVIRDFNVIEKVVHTMHTLCKSQQVTFLLKKDYLDLILKVMGQNCLLFKEYTGGE